MIAYVVDSNASDRLQISDFLERHGFAVKTFLTGTLMMAQLAGHPSMIVLNHDVGEETSGLQYLQLIKLMIPSLPVLFICKADDTATAVSALRQGAFYYIEKDQSLVENLATALNDLDLGRKRKFHHFLRSLRRRIFSFYNAG
jgi:DNA-binding NtrC family response regulator